MVACLIALVEDLKVWLTPSSPFNLGLDRWDEGRRVILAGGVESFFTFTCLRPLAIEELKAQLILTIGSGLSALSSSVCALFTVPLDRCYLPFGLRTALI